MEGSLWLEVGLPQFMRAAIWDVKTGGVVASSSWIFSGSFHVCVGGSASDTLPGLAMGSVVRALGGRRFRRLIGEQCSRRISEDSRGHRGRVPQTTRD